MHAKMKPTDKALFVESRETSPPVAAAPEHRFQRRCDQVAAAIQEIAESIRNGMRPGLCDEMADAGRAVVLRRDTL